MFGRRHIASANEQRALDWRGRPEPTSLVPPTFARGAARTLAAPADQVGVYPLQVSQQSRPVKVAVVVDPALDVRIKHPRQILQGLVTPSMECPSTDRLPYCLQRFRTCRGQERDAELPAVPDRRPRPKLIAEEVKRLDRMVSPPVRILAVDELCLLRMQSQPAGHDAGLQGAPQYLRLFGASAVADDIVRVPLEPDVGKAPSHPLVEDVVQKQIREAGTYHPTLRSSRRARHDATVLQLCRRLQPALDVEKHPAAVSMFADRLQEQLPVDAIEIAPHINV